jgi:hypothetical protein
MKKTFPVIFFLLSVVVSSKAQKKVSYDKGNALFNVGVGIERSYWKSLGLTSNQVANPSLSMEFGVSKKVSVGAAIHYLRLKKNYPFHSRAPFANDTYDVCYDAVSLAARGSYHFFTDKKIDPYGGLSWGYIKPAIRYVSNPLIDYGPLKGSFAWGAHMGIRYYVKPGIGMFGEMSLSKFAMLNVGAALKLQ